MGDEKDGNRDDVAASKYKNDFSDLNNPCARSIIFKHELMGKEVFKFLNQNCLIQFVGAKNLLIYSREHQKVFIVSIDNMLLETSIHVKNFHLMGMSNDGICYLTQNDEKKFVI